MTSAPEVAAALRQAFEERDLIALGALLTDDVRWGGDDHPMRCRGRADVVGMFEAGAALGATAEVVSCTGVQGPDGAAVVCRLRITWPDTAPGDGPAPGARVPRQRPSSLFHVYRLRHGSIAEILPSATMGDARRVAAELTGVRT